MFTSRDFCACGWKPICSPLGFSFFWVPHEGVFALYPLSLRSPECALYSSLHHSHGAPFFPTGWLRGKKKSARALGCVVWPVDEDSEEEGAGFRWRRRWGLLGGWHCVLDWGGFSGWNVDVSQRTLVESAKRTADTHRRKAQNHPNGIEVGVRRNDRAASLHVSMGSASEAGRDEVCQARYISFISHLIIR